MPENAKFKATKGFSLIELMIALTLLGGVLAVAYSLHHYGIVSFDRGQDQLARQREMRLVARLLSEKIRYAETIKIIDADAPVDIEEGQICFLVEAGLVVQKTPDSSCSITGEEGSYQLLFEKFAAENDSFRIEMTLQSGQGAKQVKISTSVVALNASSVEDNDQTEGSILCLGF